jgi:F-type H+-transporting ATPase subunit alpha
MKQKQFSTLKVSEMALTLFAVTKGFYEGVPVKKALAFEAAFLSHMKANQAAVLSAIEASGELSGDNEKILAKELESFKAGFNFN